jgi:PAS domain S-box-containing protein
MKPVYLSLKNRFAIILYGLAIISFILFVTALNQLKKAKEFNRLNDETTSLSSAGYAIDSMQNLLLTVLPNDLFFFKTGKSKIVENLNAYNLKLSEKSEQLAENFYINGNKKIRLMAFNINKHLKKYNNSVDDYVRLLNQKGFNEYGICGQIKSLIENIQSICKQEGLTVIAQKVAIISDLKDEYLLGHGPTLINKIKIENDEAKANVILSAKTVKLVMLSKLQKLDELIVNLGEFDESIGLTRNDGLQGAMNSAKEQYSLECSELKIIVKQETNQAISWGFIWLTVFFGFLIAALYIFKNQITKYFHKPLDTMKNFLAELKNGILPEPLYFKKHDELTDMAEHLNKVVEGLQTKAGFAIEIGKGKLDSKYQPLSEDDILGNALIEMEKSLQKADYEDQKYKSEEKKRIWTNEGIAKFGEILRLHSNDINFLADEIIQNLVKYLNAAQGGLFFFNDEQKDDIHLELVGAFAYDRKKFIKKSIKLGEGLIGTAALEKERIFLTEIPENYLTITSGMGEAPPRSILIVPLKLEEEVLGVAELASFHIFNQHEIEFVEKIGQTIASTITSVKINARTAKLLEQSQKQAEEMAEQEEEMRQNMEELRTTQEDFGRREAEISGFLTAVQNSTLVMVFDDSGKIIDTNEKMLDLLHSKREDLLGRNHRDLTSMGRNGDDLDKFWGELKSGRTRSVVEKIKLPDGKELYLKQTFSPVADKNGALIKVLCISNDISDIRVNEIKLEEKTKEFGKLQSDFNLLNEAIDSSLVRCGYSIEGRITEVNDNYCRITGHARTELVGKISTIYLKEEEKIQFEKIWNEVIKDKPYTGSLKRSKPTGEEIWLMSSFIPVKDEEGIVKKIFFLALDITERKLKYSLLEEANKEIDRLTKEKGQE